MPETTNRLQLTSLYERAIVASICDDQHAVDMAVRRAELRRERLTWSAIAFGSLGVELSVEPPEWTTEDEPHWPLHGAQRLLLRFADDGEMRFAILGRCACGQTATVGSVDPRVPNALALIGDALQAPATCAGCRHGRPGA
jgi:hypothetical protein